jgi:hypothetical protein
LIGVPVLAEALVRWQHAAGPFWPYVCAAPFLGTGETQELLRGFVPPSVSALDATDGPAATIARRPPDGPALSARKSHAKPAPGRWSRQQRALADSLLQVTPQDTDVMDLPRLPLSRLRHGDPASAEGPRRSCERGPEGRGDQGAPWWGGEGLDALLLDLPPGPILAVAPLLVAQGWYVVPVIQRWMASPPVLPCRALLRLLVAGAWRARRPTMPRGVILVADGARLGPKGYPALAPGRVFDNRYEYQLCRFPPIDLFQAHGIQQVRWLTGPDVAAPGMAGGDGTRPASDVLTVPARAAPVDLAGRPVGTIVAHDLAPYHEALLHAGIGVDVLSWPPAP